MGYQQPMTKQGAFEAAISSAKFDGIRMPCVILVNPFLDQNVGSVSRAMVRTWILEIDEIYQQVAFLSFIPSISFDFDIYC
jgi:hypothetical protein